MKKIICKKNYGTLLTTVTNHCSLLTITRVDFVCNINNSNTFFDYQIIGWSGASEASTVTTTILYTQLWSDFFCYITSVYRACKKPFIGMSSFGGLGRIFKTARTSWRSAPNKKNGGGVSARQCIRLYQKCDPNPQSWTSPLSFFLLHAFIFPWCLYFEICKHFFS
jgi:hypothetical protein